MKRIFSILLALTLMLALAVPAFATAIPPKSGESSKDVTASFTKAVSNDGGKVYYFTIDWTTTPNDLAYEGENATFTWDGATMKYEKTINNSNQAKIGWSGSATYTVKVTNQSNDAVTVTTEATTMYDLVATPAGETTKTAGSAAMKNESVIEYTNTTDEGTATTAEVTYTYADTNNKDTAPTDVSEGNITVGTITVTVTHD